MSRSCHSGMPSVTGATYAAHHPRQPGDPLRTDRVLLVRHRRRALLARPERLRTAPAPRCAARAVTSSATASQTVARIASAPHPLGDPVPHHHLGGHVGRPQPERVGDVGLDRRVDVGVLADRRRRWRRPRPPRRARPQPVPATGPWRRRSRRPGAPRRRARRGCRASGRPAACPGAPARGPAAPRPAGRPWPAARRWPRSAAPRARCRAGRRRSCRSAPRRPPTAARCCPPRRSGRR